MSRAPSSRQHRQQHQPPNACTAPCLTPAPLSCHLPAAVQHAALPPPASGGAAVAVGAARAAGRDRDAARRRRQQHAAQRCGLDAAESGAHHGGWHGHVPSAGGRARTCEEVCGCCCGLGFGRGIPPAVGTHNNTAPRGRRGVGGDPGCCGGGPSRPCTLLGVPRARRSGVRAWGSGTGAMQVVDACTPTVGNLLAPRTLPFRPAPEARSPRAMPSFLPLGAKEP